MPAAGCAYVILQQVAITIQTCVVHSIDILVQVGGRVNPPIPIAKDSVIPNKVVTRMIQIQKNALIPILILWE
jgi:hypothetical protein